MPVISVPTSFNINLEFEVPGLGRRILALFIDMLAQFLYLILIARIANSFNYSKAGSWTASVFYIIAIIPIFVYHIVFEITTNGQSLGKKIIGMRVVSTNGGRPSLSQYLIRGLLRISDIWIVILIFLFAVLLSAGRNGGYEIAIIFLLGIGFLLTDVILVSNSKRAQRIGDILAQTIVIRTNTKESLSGTVFREVEDNYVPAFPQVMRISDKDLNVIKKLLDGNKKGRDYDAITKAAEKVKSYLQIDTTMYSDEFLDKLLKDYNYLSAK